MIDFNGISQNILKEANNKTLSLSNILDILETPFDGPAVAEKTHDKNFNNPQSQYYQKSVQEILDMWEKKRDDSCRYGSLSDSYICECLTGSGKSQLLWKLDNNYAEDMRVRENCDAFDSFYELFRQRYDYIDREKTLYYKVPGTDYVIKGRFDALFRHKKDRHYVIIDWKTSGKIDKTPTRWTERMKGPMSMYPQLNWYRYTTQLWYYRTALAESYLSDGSPVTAAIVHFTGGNWNWVNPAYDYNKEQQDMFYQWAVKRDMILNS